MTCLDCIVLVDRMSMLSLFTVNFLMNLKSAFTLPKLQGEWVLAFGAMNYGIVFESKPVSFEAGSVVIIRK